MSFLFLPGSVVATPGALELTDHGVNLMNYLRRHLQGDWGDISEEDKKENELSLREGFRLLSSYNTKAGKLWLITEADRSATTFLLPEEY
jgi:hypothetical protein